MRADRLPLLAVAAFLLLAPAVRAEAPLDPKQTADLVVRFQAGEPDAELIGRLRAFVGDPGGDVAPALYVVVAESFRQEDPSRRQWLARLEGHDEIAALLANYLRELERAERQLDCAAAQQPECGDGLATAETGVRTFGSRAGAVRDIPIDALRDLRALAQRDRRALARARRLEQLARGASASDAPEPAGRPAGVDR